MAITFGKLVFKRALLAVRANRGWKYVIARPRDSDEVWLLGLHSGSGFGGPLRGPVEGLSTKPWDTWIAAGQMPAGAKYVEVQTQDGVVPGRVRAGFWMAAIPWGNRDLDVTYRFLDEGGAEAYTEEERIERASRFP